MRIQPIDQASPHLQAVKALGDANRATLGFLPEGAFEAYAERKQIVVALDEEGTCIGYLMYQVSASRGEIGIIHLCVHESRRREGVAAGLVGWLHEAKKRDYRGIRLKCRRDYGASHLWPQLGFVAQGEVPGRSHEGHPLVVWRLDHGHPSLLTAPAEALREARLPVVLDTNVLFGIQDEGSATSEESRALLADWLADEILLGTAAEVLNEIMRNADPAERRRRRIFAQQFHQFQTDPDKVRQIAEGVRALFPEPLSASDESDVRQLAHAIAAEVPYFVTHDSYMLGHDFANRIYADFGLSIASPSDLILRLDELARDAAYQPARLAGSRIQIGRVTADDVAYLDVFRAGDLGEKRPTFQEVLKRRLADPHRAEGLIVRNAAGQPLALTVVTRPDASELVIPLLRVLSGPLAVTLATHIAMGHVLQSIKEGRALTRVTDGYLRADVQDGLREVGYARTGDEWVKMSLRNVGSARGLAEELRAIANQRGLAGLGTQLSEALKSAAADRDEATILRIESALWPAKVTDLAIPAYIVPMRPAWARHLLGEELGQPSLFGTDPALALSWENAYYGAPKRRMQYPSRVLWYVSEDTHDPGSKHVRGCSVVQEVLVGSAKEAFRRFRRLGVYEWRDVSEIARGDPEKRVMAFRFSHTELLRHPIHWDVLQEVLQSVEGKRQPIVTVTPISSRCFFTLYGLGTGAAQQGSP